MGDEITAEFDFSDESDPDADSDVLVPELLRDVRSLIRVIRRRNDIDAAWMSSVQTAFGSPVAKVILAILVARLFGIEFGVILDGLRVLLAKA